MINGKIEFDTAFFLRSIIPYLKNVNILIEYVVLYDTQLNGLSVFDMFS